MTAKSYRHGEIVKTYEKGGKPYGTVKLPCDRCVKGVYVVGVENGQLKPHPVANGVCFKCGGLGYELKDVRLYTEKELETMERNNENAKAKRLAEQEKKMKAEFAATRSKWLTDNGWSQDGVSYVVTGDSYSIKEELKEAGFRYDPVMRWHKAEFDEKYADRLVEIKLDDVCDISAWGKGSYRIEAQKFINEKIAGPQVESTSRWIGEVGEKIKDLKVQLIKKYSFETKYGYTTLYSFQTEEGDILNWFTTTFQEVEVNDWCIIKYATIKKHDEYKGAKNTVITRAKLS